MIFQHALRKLVASAVLAASAAVAVVAAAFALFALLAPVLSAAGAAGVVAAVAALLGVICSLLLMPRRTDERHAADAPPPDLLTRAVRLARDKPLVAAAAAAAVGVVAVRNPKLVGALVSAFVAKEAVTPSKR